VELHLRRLGFLMNLADGLIPHIQQDLYGIHLNVGEIQNRPAFLQQLFRRPSLSGVNGNGMIENYKVPLDLNRMLAGSLTRCEEEKTQ
jgi:hypothetical protein